MSKRSRTQKSKRMVQAGAVVLIALAAAVLVLPVTRLLRPKVPAPPQPVNTRNDTDAAPRNVAVDSNEMSRALAVSNPRKALTSASAEPEGTPDLTVAGPDPTPEPAPVSPGGWAYLGSVISPRNSYALLRTDLGQFYLQKGSKRDGRTLIEIHPDHVILKDESGAETSIALLPPSVTWPERGPGRMTPGVGGAAAMGATALGSNLAANGKPNGPLYGAGRPELFQARPMGTVQPPARGAPTVIVNGGAVSDRGFAHEQMQELVEKVSTGDFDADYVQSMFRNLGLPEGATVEQQVEVLGKMGVTPATNPDFYKNLMEYNQSVGNEKGMLHDERQQERDQVLQELQQQGLSPEEQMKVLEEKGLMTPESKEQRERRLKEEEAARQ